MTEEGGRGAAPGDGEGSAAVPRRWRVASALISEQGPTSGEDVLLVRNRRRDGRDDWTPPGGVVEDGETLLDGLHREVREETGLAVVEWRADPLYRVGVDAPDLGWELEVVVFAALTWDGELRCGADPDGLVTEGRWASPASCRSLLRSGDRWVGEPLQSWLADPWSGTRRFAYRLHGRTRSELVVERR